MVDGGILEEYSSVRHWKAIVLPAAFRASCNTETHLGALHTRGIYVHIKHTATFQ